MDVGELKALARPEIVEIDIPEWSATVHLRAPGLSYIVGITAKWADADDDTEALTALQLDVLANTVCDAEGCLAWTIDDASQVYAQHPKACTSLIERALKLIAPGGAEVDELVGKSEEAPSSAS